MTDTITTYAGLSEDGPTSASLKLRANVLEMTQAAENACLTPRDPGGLSHSMRAALAARAANINAHDGLAEYYKSKITDADVEWICNPDAQADDALTWAMLGFADRVTGAPRQITAGEVGTLKSVGMADADIVRLCELMAFLAFQYRVITGLSLMEATSA